MCKSFKNCLCVYEHFPEHLGPFRSHPPFPYEASGSLGSSTVLKGPHRTWLRVCLQGQTEEARSKPGDPRQVRLPQSLSLLVYKRGCWCNLPEAIWWGLDEALQEM